MPWPASRRSSSESWLVVLCFPIRGPRMRPSAHAPRSHLSTSYHSPFSQGRPREHHAPVLVAHVRPLPPVHGPDGEARRAPLRPLPTRPPFHGRPRARHVPPAPAERDGGPDGLDARQRPRHPRRCARAAPPRPVTHRFSVIFAHIKRPPSPADPALAMDGPLVPTDALPLPNPQVRP